MTNPRKWAIFSCLAGFLVFGIAATNRTPQEPEPTAKRNLKILPKNISKDDLEKVMHGFNDALGVHCDFCHAKSKDPNQRWPDFASDEKPEKNIARKMMKMTQKINKKFFDFEKDESGNRKDAVMCGTCHNGHEHPHFTPPAHNMPGPPPGAQGPPPGAPVPPPANQ